MLAKVETESEPKKENKAYTIKINKITKERIEKDIELPDNGLSLIEIASLMFDGGLTKETEGLTQPEHLEKMIDGQLCNAYVFAYNDWACIVSDMAHVYDDPMEIAKPEDDNET